MLTTTNKHISFKLPMQFSEDEPMEWFQKYNICCDTSIGTMTQRSRNNQYCWRAKHLQYTKTDNRGEEKLRNKQG